ncbi:MAG: hypothetical protein ABI573_12185 [Chloroflexota bacterium]
MRDQNRASAHSAHDLELVAGLAAGDLAGADVARAGSLVASCGDCALIADDLRAIAASVTAIGSVLAGGGAPAPRDFRLTSEDAARIRGGAGSRLGSAFAPSSWMRGAGIALATFGLVGVLISAFPLNFLGAAGTAGAPLSIGAAGAASSSAGNDQGYTTASPGPLQPAAEATSAAVKASVQPERSLAVGTGEGPHAMPAFNLVTLVGATALVAGIGLILGSRRNRRSGP